MTARWAICILMGGWDHDKKRMMSPLMPLFNLPHRSPASKTSPCTWSESFSYCSHHSSYRDFHYSYFHQHRTISRRKKNVSASFINRVIYRVWLAGESIIVLNFLQFSHSQNTHFSHPSPAHSSGRPAAAAPRLLRFLNVHLMVVTFSQFLMKADGPTPFKLVSISCVLME